MSKLEIDGRITLLINRDKVLIQLHDPKARIEFAEVEIDPVSFVEAMSSLAERPCKITLAGLENVGKVKEQKPLSFEMKCPTHLWDEHKDMAKAMAENRAPKGWTPNTYFGSQNSIVYKEDGVCQVNTYMYRWVDPPENNAEVDGE